MRKNVFLVFVVTLSIVAVCITGSGNPCQVNYKTINENIPYCGASSWLHWDCLNSCTGLLTQMNNITRLRALCCRTSNCIAECHHPKDFDKDTQYCGNVCPPFFTSSPPSTASTTGSISTTQMSSKSTQRKHENGQLTFKHYNCLFLIDSF